MVPSIAWSTFALNQHYKASSLTKCVVSPTKILELVQKYWETRTPGQGREDLSKVVLVHLPLETLKECVTASIISIKDATDIKSRVTYRQAHEDPYIITTAQGTPLPINRGFIVLYSKEALLDNNGKRSSEADWEIVAVVASPFEEQEPMSPLTMARNYLEKSGGTFAPYSAKDIAYSIYFWSQYVFLDRLPAYTAVMPCDSTLQNEFITLISAQLNNTKDALLKDPDLSPELKAWAVENKIIASFEDAFYII